MPNNRVPMRKVKRILELSFVASLSVRAIARSVGVGRSSVSQIFLSSIELGEVLRWLQ